MCRRGRSHTFTVMSHDWARKCARMNEVNSQASTHTEPSWKLRLLNRNFKIVSRFWVIIYQVWDLNSTFWEKYHKSFLQSRKAGSTALLLFNLMTTWQRKLSAAPPFILYVSSSSSSPLAPAQTRAEELPLDLTSVCVSVGGESSERVNLSSGCGSYLGENLQVLVLVQVQHVFWEVCRDRVPAHRSQLRRLTKHKLPPQLRAAAALRGPSRMPLPLTAFKVKAATGHVWLWPGSWVLVVRLCCSQ